jgi:hypothetical protein
MSGSVGLEIPTKREGDEYVAEGGRCEPRNENYADWVGTNKKEGVVDVSYCDRNATSWKRVKT